MQRKIFIGVDLPIDVKKRLMQKVERWDELPIRWSKEGNLHLTLAFLGHIDDSLIFDICKRIKEAVSKMKMFDIKLDKIELGPTQDKNARVILFTGRADEELKKLSENIEKSLGIFRENKKVFKPHITLGRIQKYGWQKLKETPKVSENFSVLLPIESVQVFESVIIEGKRKFDIINSSYLDEE